MRTCATVTDPWWSQPALHKEYVMLRGVTGPHAQRSGSLTWRYMLAPVAFLLCPHGSSVASPARELAVGVASVDITPTGPVALVGQWALRISKKVETPLTANVLALESRKGDQSLDAAVMISCDLVWGPDEILNRIRVEVHKRLPDLDVRKIFLSGTHTHTSPVLKGGEECLYQIPKEGAVQVEEYQAFLARRIGDAVVQAWTSRAPGSVTWGLSHAVVAYNRRTVYADGSAKMYGRTDLPEFRNLEAGEDHDVGALFFWDKAGKLISIVVNVSCPAQEVEHRQTINADYWHPVRESVRKRYGQDVCVLGWIGAAGDQSPHLRYRQRADDRMTKLRGLDRLGEIARRICRAVDEAYEVVKDDRNDDVSLRHKVETLRLPVWRVSDAQYAEAKAARQKYADQIAKDAAKAVNLYAKMKWQEALVRRYERQKADPQSTFDMELHVVRLGDVAICTNPFELYTDYGIRIKARSRAVQTFVVQLTGGPGDGSPYLPTESAVRGGGYSAMAPSCNVGPKGGQILVDRTVALTNAMWKKAN